MPPTSTPDPIQPQALRDLTALHVLQPDWAGSLILSVGLDAEGSALSIAANIAGAVSLAIDDSPARLREVVRTGAVDFVVNTLDEAIRAMKNEVRKRAPLSVALAASPAVVLAEILSRGLAPQLFTTFVHSPEHEHLLADAATRLASPVASSPGAALIDFKASDDVSPPPGYRSAQSLIVPLTERHGWTLHTFTFNSPADLRAFDARALAQLPPEDRLRRRWLEAAPRILQRQRPPQRSLWLTPAEAETLVSPVDKVVK